MTLEKCRQEVDAVHRGIDPGLVVGAPALDENSDALPIPALDGSCAERLIDTDARLTDEELQDAAMTSSSGRDADLRIPKNRKVLPKWPFLAATAGAVESGRQPLPVASTKHLQEPTPAAAAQTLWPNRC